jgi:hypothetical protein
MCNVGRTMLGLLEAASTGQLLMVVSITFSANYQEERILFIIGRTFVQIASKKIVIFISQELRRKV